MSNISKYNLYKTDSEYFNNKSVSPKFTVSEGLIIQQKQTFNVGKKTYNILGIKNILCFIFIFITVICNSQEISFDKEYFMNSKIYYKTRFIPNTFYREIKKKYNIKFRLANPTHDFQQTDVVRNYFLKDRRLIFFIKNDEKCVLFYEHGGRGRHNHCLVFILKDDHVKDIMSIRMLKKISDVNDFIQEAINKKFIILQPNFCQV